MTETPTKRLKSKKSIDRLFHEGTRCKAYPIHLLGGPSEEGGLHVGYSAPKRVFRRAVDRNRVKRRLRAASAEVIEELSFAGNHDIMLVYVGARPLVYPELKDRIRKAINRYLHEQDIGPINIAEK